MLNLGPRGGSSLGPPPSPAQRGARSSAEFSHPMVGAWTFPVLAGLHEKA